MLVKIEAYFDGQNWRARSTGVSAFIQGATFDELLENIKEALTLRFEEKLNQGETLQVSVLSVLMEMEVRGMLQPHKPRGSTIPLSDEEIQRRKQLLERILKKRNELPSLGMTTADLVHLARQGLEYYDET